MGLRSRLILFIVGVTTIVIVSWGVTVVNNEAQMLRIDAAARGHDVLRTLAVPCAVALANQEIETLDAILAEFRARGGTADSLRNVAILDEYGVVLAHSEAEEYGRIYTDSFTRAAISSAEPLVYEVRGGHGNYLRLSMPVTAGLRWGTATAELSLGHVENRITAMSREIVLGSAMMAALGAIALSVLISSSVLQPLTAFSRTAKRISQGELSARVPELAQKDELGLMARVFNEMAAQIEDDKARLESAVERRTEELRTANRALANANEDLGRAVAELERLASTDGLTGLLNHRAFQETLNFEVRRAKRNNGPVSVLMLDVDHFKAYNDTHGHPAGDQVLIQVARLLRDHLRDIDVVARYGGEEFSVILLDTGPDDAQLVAQKLRDAIRSYPFPNAERSQPEGRLTVSVGLASYPVHGATPAALVAAADEALYVAKRRGRDQVVAQRAAQ